MRILEEGQKLRDLLHLFHFGLKTLTDVLVITNWGPKNYDALICARSWNATLEGVMLLLLTNNVFNKTPGAPHKCFRLGGRADCCRGGEDEAPGQPLSQNDVHNF